MLIIDSKKDYYDFVCGTYGTDNSIVYDRRNSKKIPIGLEPWLLLSPKKIEGDRKMVDVPYWRLKGLKREKYNRSRKKIPEGRIFFFMIECGMYRYYYEVERWLETEDSEKASINVSFISKEKITKEEKKKYPAPLYLCGNMNYWSSLFGFRQDIVSSGIKMFSEVIENPILKDTPFAIIPPEDIWKDIYEYLSSLKDADIIDNRTNDEHIESAGMDKKESFRNIKHRLK